MRHRIRFAAAAMLALSCLTAAGQTSAELLQKGIYTQETVGDLDGAIKIYRQVVASAAESRALGAQAQFRLATCLLKKGDRALALKAFEQLVNDYPDQKELVAQARAYLPGSVPLLPIPWTPGEFAEYSIKLHGGMTIGKFVYTVESSPSRPQNALLTTRAWVGGVPHQWSRVEVDRETMRPISNTYNSILFGEVRLDYEDRQARYQKKGKPAATIALDGQYWDNEEAMWVMRRMPLASGYKTQLPIVSPAGIPMKLDLAVTAVEDVQVPAGKFRAYKVELSLVRQTIWFAVDSPRTAVKIDAPGASIELTGLRRIDTEPVTFRDNFTGLSVTVPAGWMFDRSEGVPAGEIAAKMLDPDGRAAAALWVKAEKTEVSQIAQKLRDGVDEKAKSRAPAMKGYKIRPASIQTRAVGGHQALSCSADYVENGVNMVEYLVWVRSANNGALFTARMAADGFDDFRPRFDAIVETAKLQ